MSFRRRPPRWLTACVSGLVLVSLTGGCAKLQPVDVVASFYPLQFVAERVTGGQLSVATLTAPGVEPHDLELTVRQTAQLARARIVLYESGLQPSVDNAVASSGPRARVNAAKVISLRSSTEGRGLDPHFWQDPVLLGRVAEAFAHKLAGVDPDHAATYLANARTLVGELNALDSQIREGLAHCARHTLVVSHDAFEYFGARYGLKIISIAGITPDAEPSAKRLGELRRAVVDDGVTTVFSEHLASPKMAQTLAAAAGVRTEVLDPLEGLTDPSTDYLSVMRTNLEKIRKANSCS